jgi:hypothetical protein
MALEACGDSGGDNFRFLAGSTCDGSVKSDGWEGVMQMEEVLQLQEAWKKKGNPPCKHAVVDREYYLGSHTGDSVCTTCGSYVDDEEKPRKRKRIVIPR